MSFEDFEAVIGLEIHAQLLSRTKLFCGCSTDFKSGENENACPVCTGMPGALPVLNRKALELSVKTGLALNCAIRDHSVFARKNYFYPDLPKGYQISQYDQPLCEKGFVEFYLGDEKKRVGITRAHMEEDAGKSSHVGGSTLLNYNRSSVPLLEIVSEPDMRSAQEAAEYARSVHSILLFAEVCDGNLEEGSMRCDCNVSVRKRNSAKLGTKVELKNINSFRFIEKAIEFEIQRQIGVLEAGQKVIQETRLYDPDKNKTYSMRTKEEAHDYRYFPDPDLLPVRIEKSWIEKIRAELPELPLARAERFQAKFGLPKYDSQVLTSEKSLAEYFENVARVCGNPKLASNWVMVELLGKLNDSKTKISKSPVHADQLGAMLSLVEKGSISGKIAKTVFAEMFTSGRSAEQIISEKGLNQISDSNALEKTIEEILQKNPNQAAEFRGGKEKMLGFFVGQVMKATAGRANPELVNEILKRKLQGN